MLLTILMILSLECCVESTKGILSKKCGKYGLRSHDRTCIVLNITDFDFEEAPQDGIGGDYEVRSYDIGYIDFALIFDGGYGKYIYGTHTHDLSVENNEPLLNSFNIVFTMIEFIIFMVIITYYVQYKVLFLLIFVAAFGNVYSDNIMQKITASDGIPSDTFGESVAISNGRAIVGTSFSTAYSGKAYIFSVLNGTWIETTKLMADDAYLGDSFGKYVAIYNDHVILGTQRESAYIFSLMNGAWTQTVKFVAPNVNGTDIYGNPIDNIRFGESVAISNEHAIIGAPGDLNNNRIKSGAAYIFSLVNGSWIETIKLVASDGGHNDFFGRSVAISNAHIIIGAYGDDDQGATSGSAYIFSLINGTWIQTAKLLPSDGSAGDYSGLSVAIYNEHAIVSSDGALGNNGVASGAAYIFSLVNGVWTETIKLVPSDGINGDDFGNSVDISKEHVIIGASLNGDKGFHAGKAYVFSLINGVWIETAKLLAPNASITDKFGDSVAISNGYIIVGASQTSDYGSAYMMTNYHSCGNVWDETHDKNRLNDTNNTYLVNYRWTACEFTRDPTSEPTTDPTGYPTFNPTDSTQNPSKPPSQSAVTTETSTITTIVVADTADSLSFMISIIIVFIAFIIM